MEERGAEGYHGGFELRAALLFWGEMRDMISEFGRVNTSC